jgi:hypothetical protein
VTVYQKEPLPKLLLEALSDLVTAEVHPAVEIVVEDVSDASYLSKLHLVGFELFYGLGLPRQTLIFMDSERGFILEDNPNIQAFKSLSAREVEDLYYKLLWSRFGHAVSLCGSVKATDAAENLFCLALEREREVWCRLRGDRPGRLPGVGQTVAVFAWEKWFSHILDVIQLEFLSREKSCSGDVC